MITCPTCGTQLEDGAKFCLECGTPIPQTKKCINCGFELPLSAKFCPECGTKQDGSAAPASGSGFSMGDKNVIAGDVIGHKEETHIAGNATIIKNEDQTKQVKKCHICGSLVQIVEGFDCPECGQFTCASCFDSDAGCCTNCVGQKEQNNINRYKDALKMVLADGKIEPSERTELLSLQMQLGISSGKAAQLENEMRNAGSKNELTTVEKLSLEKARNLFYKEEQTEQALEVLEPIYDAHKHEEEILALYLPILAEVDSDKALQIIETLPFDILMSYITAIDIAIKKDELDEAERKYKEAARIWPENALVKCYQVLLNYALYKKFNQQNFLNKAKELVENLGEAQNELELSMQVRVQMFMQEVAGETVPEITKQFCDDNQLYFGVMNKDLFEFETGTRINASDAAEYIKKLEPGQYSINLTGKMDESIWKELKESLSQNENVKINLKLPKGVTKIREEAFSYCESLTSITIPATVTEFGKDIFEWCESLTSINVSLDNRNFKSVEGILYSKDQKTLLYYPAGKKEEKFSIPDFVTKIGDSAFEDCLSLTSINIPDSVTIIGECAFCNCHSLTSINIPDSVTKIGDQAFRGCKSLTNLNIPDSFIEIGDYAFFNCRSLTSMNIPDSVTKIGENAFEDCLSLTSINIPDSVIEIGDYAFCNCHSLTSINIPDSVTKIGEVAFVDCFRLKSISIPKNCKVADDAFDDGIEIIRRT